MTVWLTIFSVNRFLRLIESKQPGPEVALLSGVDCISNMHHRLCKALNLGCSVIYVVIYYITVTDLLAC